MGRIQDPTRDPDLVGGDDTFALPAGAADHKLGKLKLSIPWAAEPWHGVSSFHPLLMSMLENTDALGFDDRILAVTPARRTRMRRRARVLRSALVEFNAVDDVEKFISTRGVDQQAVIPDDVHGVLLPNTPLTLADRPFAIELEEVSNFWRYLHSVADPQVDVPASPFLPMIRYLLESDACRVIITHLRKTQESIALLFKSDTINRKTTFIPLGADYQARAPLDLRKPDNLTFLFTNSFAYSLNFLTRGGMETISAFGRLSEAHPGHRLIVVSEIPEPVRDYVTQAAESIPGLEIIERRVDEEEMFQLYCEADAFLLPSLTLHSYSTVRAMAVGATPIVGDGPGYEEFIRHGETGFMVKRSLDRSWYDPSLIMKRSAGLVTRFDEGLRDEIFSALMKLVENPSLRRSMSAACREHIAQNHRLEDWRRSVRETLLQHF